MKIFADTANLSELRELDSMGLVSGITTNPPILAREGKDALASLRAIRGEFPKRPLFAQVVVPDWRGMVEQGRKINAVGEGMVVKIPATNEGIKAMAALRREGVYTCATAIFTSAQALLCAAAGASYAAPYTGETNAVGYDGKRTLEEMVETMRSGDFPCQVLAAAIYKPQDIADAAVIGADIATISYADLMAVCDKPGPLTGEYIGGFMKQWNAAGAFFG